MKAHTTSFTKTPLPMKCVGFLAGMLLTVSTGQAQQRRTAEKRDGKAAVVVKLRDFEGLGKHSLLRTPVIVARGRNQQGEWLRVMTEFDTYPAWVDELIFQYYVLTETEIEQQKVFFLFKRAVRHRDIKRGRRHLSAVFLRPNTILRYGMPVAVAVEIVHEGEIVDGGSKQPSTYPERWWKEARVVESERVTFKDGYLLSRSQTPFALVDIDDYEVSH